MKLVFAEMYASSNNCCFLHQESQAIQEKGFRRKRAKTFKGEASPDFLAGWLVVWLSGRLAAWLPGCLAVWLSACPAAPLPGCPACMAA